MSGPSLIFAQSISYWLYIPFHLIVVALRHHFSRKSPIPARAPILPVTELRIWQSEIRTDCMWNKAAQRYVVIQDRTKKSVAICWGEGSDKSDVQTKPDAKREVY